jgi:hypothetical protein
MRSRCTGRRADLACLHTTNASDYSNPWLSSRRSQSLRWFPVVDATQAKSVEVCVVSSRRVRKGPGRRPMSAKREQFLKLLARGWTPAAPRREVGISRSASRNWRNGHTVRLKDGTVRFVPPLDPLTTKAISPRFLSEAERVEIATAAMPVRPCA